MNDQERNDYMTMLKDPGGMNVGSGNELDLHTGVRGEEQKSYLLGLIVVRILQEQEELETKLGKLQGEVIRKAKKETLQGSIKVAEEPSRKKLFGKNKE